MKKKSVMKKLISSSLVAFLIVLSIPISANAATLTEVPEIDRTGYTPISTKEELAAINNDPYGSYYLTNDIEFTWYDFAEGGAFYNSGELWTPIGSGFVKVPVSITTQKQFTAALNEYGDLYIRVGDITQYGGDDIYYVLAENYSAGSVYYYLDAFYGTIDGNGYSIKNLRVYRILGDHGGFVGVNFGNIHDLSLINVSSNCFAYSGGICAENYGNITDCYVTGSTSARYRSGGICAENYGYIFGCESYASVNGGYYLGGIAGGNYGTIQCCLNSGKVSGEYGIGGICGLAYASTLIDCVASIDNSGTYDANTVNGEKGYTGGIVGYELSDGETTNFYKNCFYANVSSHEGIGNVPVDETFGGKITVQRIYEPNIDYLRDHLDFENIWYENENKIIHLATCIPRSSVEVSAVWDGSVANAFESGSGSETDPFLISDASQLAYLSRAVAEGNTFAGQYIKLAEDIIINDISVEHWFKNAVEWMPIGSNDTPFEGSFDGDGHSISGVYIDGQCTSYEAALFGFVSNGSVKGIRADVYVKGVADVGGICGFIQNTEITDCHVSGFVLSAGLAGMICGGAEQGIIKDCTSSGNAYGDSILGGICGYSYNDSQISQCANYAEINATNIAAGGICGVNNSSIQDCYNVGNIAALSECGGICGENYQGTVKTSYSIGAVTAYMYVGAICGYSDENAVTYCYYLEESARDFGDIIQYGVGNETPGASTADTEGCTASMSTHNLKYEFRYEGFDFKNVWTMYGDDSYKYAKLKSFVTPPSGDVNGDGTINSVDSNLLKRYLIDSETKIDEYNADVNFDVELNAIDSNLLKRIVAGSN